MLCHEFIRTAVRPQVLPADDIVQAVLRHATVLGAQVVVLATTPRRSHMALMEIAQEYNLCIITASLPLPE